MKSIVKQKGLKYKFIRAKVHSRIEKNLSLLKFTQWPAGQLEQIEKLEQLRYLENGIPIRMSLVDFTSVAIDTPEDLRKAAELL